MTATATILALMLTLLSLSTNSDDNIKDHHYKRILQIAFLNTVGLIVSTIFLLLHCVPLEKTDQLPSGWFQIIYYVVLITSALLGGIIVSVVLMLYSALKELIYYFGLGRKEKLAISDE